MSAARSSPWGVLVVASVAAFLVSLDGTVVIAAFPALRESMRDATPAQLSWVLNAYTILYAALLVPAGRVADRVGRKRAFLAGLAVFGAASLLCGGATTLPWLIAARVLQAAGAAALVPASLALVLQAFPASRRSVAVSVYGAVGALAAALGPAFGSWLIDISSWQAVFFINVPLVVFSLWRAHRRLDESRSPEADPSFDPVGVTLLVVSVSALVLGIVEAGAWAMPVAGTVVALGIAGLGAFASWARNRRGAALDLALFRERSFAWANAATLVFGATFTLMFLAFFLFLTGVWHYPLRTAGLAIVPGPLAVIPAAIVAGRVASRRGHRLPIVVGSLIFAASNMWFLWRLGPESAFFTVWLPGLVCGGMGIGLVLPSLTGAAAARLGPAALGAGNAVQSAIRQVGGSFGAALAVLLVGPATSGIDRFELVYGCLVAGSLVTAALAAPIDTRPVAGSATVAPEPSLVELTR